MKPLVSVCMASFNHAPFIRVAVESVLQQSFVDWELVITDDGSTDGTLAALDGLTDERLRIDAFPENRSACVALNHCIRRARGRFIAVLNSDDAWAPEKLAKQLAVMREQPQTAAVFTLAAMIDERGRPLPDGHPSHQTFQQRNRQRIDWLRRLILQGNCLCHPSVLVRSDVYREVGLYDECMAQLPDLDMWIRICMRHDIWVIQEPLTMFRLLDHERNASGNRPEVRARCAVENMLLYLKAFRDFPVEMAAVVRSPAVESARHEQRTTIEALASMLDDTRGQAWPPGMRVAQLIWMHEQLSRGGDWQTCKQFIQKTAADDPLNIRVLEALGPPPSRGKPGPWRKLFRAWR
jgi:glycosyltransferase involved in cell wall biosynthesis